MIVAFALGAAAWWAAGPRSDASPRAASDSPEPLFERVVVPPGDDPSAIAVRVDDARVIEIDTSGALLVHHGPRVRRQEKPRAYQDIDGRRHEVSVRFDLLPAGDPRLVVGPYDRTFPLVIDPQPGKDDPQP